MAIRYNLSVGENLDKWIEEQAAALGIAKNAFVIMCVANTRKSDERMRMMSNSQTRIKKTPGSS